jgi:dinuclear metal center YbgI/SA1388 family protein
MLLHELEKYLNEYLNISLIKDCCPNGVQVEGRREIKKIATAVSANLMTLQKAAETDVDALIVHHGLFWQGDPYPIIGARKKKIELLLKEGISLLAYHLPLDAHQEIGNNWQAARNLGWQQLLPFGEYNGTMIGVKGVFSPQPIEVIVSQIETYYEHPATVALGGKKIVSTGALISGGAYRELSQAVREKVDLFITGNFDEPAWGVAHENQIHFLALGHSATERVGPRALAEHLQKKWDLSSFFLDIVNPF